MDWLRRNFLEDPLYVYIALAFCLLALAALWHERRGRRLAMTLLAPPALAGIVFLVSALVVTDREQIVAASRDIAASIESGSVQQILKHLDGRFTASLGNAPIGRAEVPAVAALQRSTHGIQRIRLTQIRVEVDGTRARMHAVTVIDWAYEGAGGRSPVSWDLEWTKNAQGWQVLTVEEPHVDLK